MVDKDQVLSVGDMTLVLQQWAEIYELLGTANGKFFAKYPNIHSLHIRMDILRQDLERRRLWGRVSRFTSEGFQMEKSLELTEVQSLAQQEMTTTKNWIPS